MKDQVTSIEQSKRLIELGVPAEKASMVWHRMFRDKRAGYTEWSLKIGGPQNTPQLEAIQIIPAYTVADLLGIIKSINVFGNPTIEKIGDAGWRFEFGAITGEREYGFNECQNIIELLVGRIEWAMSNEYELNI